MNNGADLRKVHASTRLKLADFYKFLTLTSETLTYCRVFDILMLIGGAYYG